MKIFLKPSLGILALAVLVATFASCTLIKSSRTTLSADKVKFEEPFSEYIAPTGEDIEISLADEDRDGEEFLGLGWTYLKVSIPVKILKEIPNAENISDVDGKIKSDKGYISLSNIYISSSASEHFSDQEIEDFKKLLSSPAGTEGKLVLKAMFRLQSFDIKEIRENALEHLDEVKEKASEIVINCPYLGPNN